MSRDDLHKCLEKAYNHGVECRAAIEAASKHSKELPYPQQVTLGESNRMIGYWVDWLRNMVASTAPKEKKE